MPTHSEFRQIHFELLNGAYSGRAIPGVRFLTLIATLPYLHRDSTTTSPEQVAARVGTFLDTVGL